MSAASVPLAVCTALLPSPVAVGVIVRGRYPVIKNQIRAKLSFNDDILNGSFVRRKGVATATTM